ncbi:MAG: DegV family protein [Bacteroidales bacterium]|nr:DegV family protein [Bacteroidales bacterium]
MAIKVITDSSANMMDNCDGHIKVVPLEIRTEERIFSDTDDLDVDEMIDYFRNTKKKSSTACPSPGDWLEAFGDAEEIIVVTLTGNLSGCYNSAKSAADMYMSEHPQRKVFVLDTLSAGPEVGMIAKKAMEIANEGALFENACERLKKYAEHTRLTFSLASLHNFASNGRVNPALAKAIAILNFKIVGRASSVGDLQPIEKCRGEKCSLIKVLEEMESSGYAGGRVWIHHTRNERLAKLLGDELSEKYPAADVSIGANRGLCSYYAEAGSVLIGYEM